MSSKFDKLLVLDCETSGINFNSLHCNEGMQIVSCGLIVASVSDFKPIDELYLEIKWNGVAQWHSKAEEIHGMSKAYLEANGVSEEEAVMQIALFLEKHFGLDKALNLLGHNVVNFDLPFFKDLLWRHGLHFKFAHRHFETFALSMGTLGAWDSNELFETLGFGKRGKHNALEDARMSLKVYQIINKMWKRYVE